MQVTETLSEGLKRAYTITVPAADLEGRRSKRLEELGRTVRLPGFRPGKVPTSVVRQRFGNAVNAEVLEESVNEATQQVLDERKLRSAGQPRVEVTSAGEAAKDLEFKVELELLPEIAIPDLASIEVTRLKAAPVAETIDRALAELARRQRKLEPAEPRPAAKGDILTIDFTGQVDGTAFPGGTGADLDVEVGGPGFIPRFTDQLEGLAPGESRQLQATFPESYGVKDLAGKAATFDVTAKALKIANVPALDDALANELGFDGGLAEVREAVTAQMQRELDQRTRLRVKRELMDALAARVDFPVPEGMLEAEFAQIWQRLEQQRRDGDIDEEDRGKDDATLRAEYRAIAERRVRLGLLLAEIGRANGITISNEELTRAMRIEAGRYPGQEAQVLDFFRKTPQAVETLRAPLYEEKVVDYVLELARVTERVVTPEELAEEPPLPAGIAQGGPASAPEAEPAATEGASA
jgi:trigger factor